MIHAYTGDGKGKSTAALGLLIRAFGADKKVAIIYFDKGSETYRHNETLVFEKLGIKFFITGKERMKPDGSFRFENIPEDSQEALRGIKLAKELISSGKYEVLVLDEALSAVEYDLLDIKELENLIAQAPKELELVITGRCTNEELLDKADLVTCMTKKKHYFDKGIQARPGIEY